MRKLMISLMLAAALVNVTACTQGNTQDQTAQQTTAAETTEGKDVDLDVLHEAVKEAYGEQYIPSMPYDDQAMLDLFGVDSGWMDSYIAEGPMISVHVDTFIAIKAKEGSADQVEKALTDYRQGQIDDSMQYPMNMVKLQASQIVRRGNYVFFIMLGETPSDGESEEAMLKAAEDNNQIAVDVIDGYLS